MRPGALPPLKPPGVCDCVCVGVGQSLIDDGVSAGRVMEMTRSAGVSAAVDTPSSISSAAASRQDTPPGCAARRRSSTYGARVLGEAAGRRIPGVRSDVATPSYLVPPARDEAPGDIFVGLRVELFRMPNKAYDGLRGVVVAPTTQGHWAVMPLPEDQLRALSLRAFARAKAQGVRPTRVRNKDPLKPLPVPGKFLRPIIDPERAPPRPKDGIGI